MNSKFKKILLLFGDIMVLYLSLYLTLVLRYAQNPDYNTLISHIFPFSIVFIFWILMFYISNLYNLNLAVNNTRFLKLTLRSLAISSSFSIFFFYLMPWIKIAPKTNMIIYLIIFAILFYFWRRLFNFVLKSYLPKQNFAFIGINNQVKELILFFKKNSHLGLRAKFAYSNNREIKELNKTPVVHDINKINDLIRSKKIETVVLCSDQFEEKEKLRSTLLKSLSLKINFIGLANFYEIITGKVPLDAINKTWFLENLSEGNKKFFDIFKRFYDITLGIMFLILTLPFWPLIMIIVKLESKGPIFFLSKRTGKNNKVFNLFKFRTMREEGNDRKMTAVNDPRITRFGKFMRKTRIDEIPQVINILKGDLSFVGPRPERPEFVAKLEEAIPFYKERLLVKPGATGWAVVNEYHSPSIEDSIKKLQFDLFYIKNRSIYLDLTIILKTIATILGKKGV
jgi:exopolysaccharide biosynthesis polyprenyl glycosylphosphotransferase